MRHAILLQFFLVLFVMSQPYAYIEYGGALYCSGTCADCVAALNNNPYDTVYLNSSLSSTGNCIDNPSGATNKTFDCQGNSISGDGTSSGIYIASKSNVTIKNCGISGFYRGLYLNTLQLSHIDNLTILDSSYDGIYFLYVGNSTLSNSTSSNSSHEGMSLDYSGDVLIINNTFSGARQQALEGGGVINCTIVYNTCYDSEQGIDFHIQGRQYHYNTISNNTIYDVAAGIAYSDYATGNLIVNNTISNLSYSPLNWGSYISIGNKLYVSSSCNNTIENNTGDGRPIYFYHDETRNLSDFEAGELILCNMDNSTVQNVTLQGGGLVSLLSDGLLVNSSYSYNAPNGFQIHMSGFTLANSISSESTYRDLDILPYDESISPIFDRISVVNVTGSGGLPINYTSTTVNWSDFESSQVFLYGANNSVLHNMVVRGSDSLDNNGVQLMYATNVTITSSTSDDNYVGFKMYYVYNLTFANNSMDGNAWDGLFIYDAENVSVSSSNASGNGGYGIYLAWAESGSMSSATTSGNAYSGVFVRVSEDLVLDSLASYGNSADGIAIYGNGSITISNSVAYSNGDPDSDYMVNDPFQKMEQYPAYYSGICVVDSTGTPPQEVHLANNTAYSNTYYGIAINKSDNVTSTSDRVYGNSLADLYIGTDATAREVYFNNLLLHSSNYPNMSLSDQLEANTTYTVKQVASPSSAYTGELTAVHNRVINITNITGSPTIDSLIFAWGNPEQTNYNESTFDLWRYVTSWVDMNATMNTTANTANYSSITTEGVYGLLGVYTYVEDEGGEDIECTDDSDCGTCEVCVDGTCELPSGACLSDGDCTGEGETCSSCSCISPECIDDSDCAGEGETCINYECTAPECTDDIDCPTGYTCENYECVSPECTADEDCFTLGEGYTCANNVCTPPECTQNEDCAECHECSGYACILGAGACLLDSDCSSYGAGYVCTACECTPPAYECTYDEDCPGEGYICSNHVCYAPECTTNNDCSECYECLDYECELPAGSCGVNSDCLIEGEGYTCDSCSCIPPECADDSECIGDGVVCENYVCVPPNCIEDEDCPSGYTCENFGCAAPECFYNNDCSENQICKDYMCMDRKEERPESGSPKPTEEVEGPEEVEVGGEEEGGEGRVGSPSFVSEILDSISEIMLVTASPDEGAGEGGEVQVEQTSLSATGWAFTLGAGALILYLLLRKFLPKPGRRG